MKIYQSAKFIQNGNVMVCILTASINVNGATTPEFKVKGIARCAPEDKFDELTGKRIAESRATVKLYKKADALVAKHMKQCQRDLDNLRRDVERMDELKSNEQYHYEQIFS